MSNGQVEKVSILQTVQAAEVKERYTYHVGAVSWNGNDRSFHDMVVTTDFKIDTQEQLGKLRQRLKELKGTKKFNISGIFALKG